MPLMWIQALVCGLFMLPGLLSAGELNAPAPPSLMVDAPLSNAGFYKVSWEVSGEVSGQPSADAARTFELQEARDADFTQPVSVYKGPDHARTFSGRADGTYYYRLRIAQTGADWSAPAQVQVAHHPLTRAWMFFAMGAVVFVATLILILSASKESSRS